MGDELGLCGEDLVALETAVRLGDPVDAGRVLGQVALPERRVVTLVASGKASVVSTMCSYYFLLVTTNFFLT